MFILYAISPPASNIATNASSILLACLKSHIVPYLTVSIFCPFDQYINAVHPYKKANRDLEGIHE